MKTFNKGKEMRCFIVSIAIVFATPSFSANYAKEKFFHAQEMLMHEHEKDTNTQNYPALYQRPNVSTPVLSPLVISQLSTPSQNRPQGEEVIDTTSRSQKTNSSESAGARETGAIVPKINPSIVKPLTVEPPVTEKSKRVESPTIEPIAIETIVIDPIKIKPVAIEPPAAIEIPKVDPLVIDTPVVEAPTIINPPTIKPIKVKPIMVEPIVIEPIEIKPIPTDPIVNGSKAIGNGIKQRELLNFKK